MIIIIIIIIIIIVVCKKFVVRLSSNKIFNYKIETKNNKYTWKSNNILFSFSNSI